MITRHYRLLVASLAGLAVCPALALAQDAAQPAERELVEVFGRPLGEPRAVAKTQMMMTQSDGKDTVTVRINDGEVSAEVNGKPLPAERIRRGENTIEILGEDGSVKHTFRVATIEPRADRFAPRARAGQALRLERGGPDALVGGRAQPKVMIGITMSDAEPRLLEHLGLKDTSGVLVDSVVPGLGAEKAGLQAHDLITEIDGKRNLTQGSLREVLAAKKPGDEVKVKFVRKGGNEQEAVIKLEAFDSGRLGVAADEIAVEGQEIFPGMGEGFFFAPEFDRDQIRELLDEAMKDLRNQIGDAGELRENALKHLEEAMKQLEDTKIKVRNWAQEGGGQWQEFMPRVRILDREGERALVRPVPPDAPRPPAAGGNLDRIAEQLERLSQRLDAIEKKLEEKK